MRQISFKIEVFWGGWTDVSYCMEKEFSRRMMGGCETNKQTHTSLLFYTESFVFVERPVFPRLQYTYPDRNCIFKTLISRMKC